jgi:hypothetical protein
VLSAVSWANLLTRSRLVRVGTCSAWMMRALAVACGCDWVLVLSAARTQDGNRSRSYDARQQEHAY